MGTTLQSTPRLASVSMSNTPKTCPSMPSHRPLGPLSASTGTPLYQHTEAYGSSGSAAETAHRPAHAACDRATRSPSHTASRPEALTHTHTHTHTYVDPCRRAAITSHRDSSPHPHTPSTQPIRYGSANVSHAKPWKIQYIAKPRQAS